MLLPGADLLLERRAQEQPQRDGLCGPFWALLALEVVGGRSGLTQEDVARAAGSRAGGAPVLPPGEESSPPACTLPQGDPAEAGTSAAGLCAALTSLAVVPVPGLELQEQQLVTLLRALGELAGPLVCLANLATGQLSGTWSVGHVVALVGLDGDVVAVADSYPSLGVHSHPAALVAAALRREDEPAEGGLLLVAAAARERALLDVVRVAGLSPGLWDNGSPAPAGMMGR